MSSNNFFNKKNLRIIYKLLHDILFILFVFFILTLIAEGLLPGIVSSRLGLYKIILLIFCIFFLIQLAFGKIGDAPAGSFSNKKSSYVLLFILAALIFNGMLNLGLPLNIFVLILALTVLYFSFNLFFPPTASS